MARNYCQNPFCHMHGTEDRFSQKHNGYITRKAKGDYYGWFCTQTCLLKFIKINIEQIINLVGKKDSPSVRKMGELQYYELRDSFYNTAKTENPSGSYKEWDRQADNSLLNHVQSNN